MKIIIRRLQTDRPLFTGLFFLFISALLFAVTFSGYQNFRDTFTPLFFIHYGIAVLYFFYLSAWKELRLFQLFRGKSKAYHLILLLLLNISAYSLNQTLPVFHESVDWLTVFLVVENALLLVYLLAPKINKAFASILLFVFTLALLFNIYQMLMIFPYMAIGLIAFPFLGISLHVLVPLAYVVALVFIIKDLISKGANWVSLALACSSCSLILGYYILQWNNVNHSLTRTIHHQLIPGAVAELPEWIRLAQTLPDNVFTEKALQSGLIYQEPYTWSSWVGDGLRFEDTKFHDPLITIAGFAGGKIDIDRQTKIKILDARYNMRHESADRFWSGLNLKTSDIVANVELFPAYRLAYTELNFRIKNELYSRGSSWFGQEEALYTFQLPEGGAVSSLSLWIEGKEAKARLTTKSKAETAYNTIVGREVRDPSVVYWMEGNKIRVRVFPCTPAEDRQFKIGISSPLTLSGDRLIYQNTTFKGPDFKKAKASINILIKDSEETPESSINLTKSGHTFSWSGQYREDWTVSTKAVPLSQEAFHFQGHAYSIKQLQQSFSAFNPLDIYLDLHAGWSSAEIQNIASLFPDKLLHIYNFNTGLMQLMRSDEIIDLLEQDLAPQFSLFPFHKVKNPENSLIICHGNRTTPNLSDLEKTTFNEKLFDRLSKSLPFKVFDLNSLPSDYIRSLHEFKVIQYTHGSVGKLESYIKAEKFPEDYSSTNTIALIPAGITIQRETATKEQSGNAPDHLLRLFSYNQVLKSIGKNYFNRDYLQEEIIKEAALGNVVTPISSLIVLETLHDYKRFEIDENKDSLGNAAINASGAVPEPHEWALIIAGVLFLSWLWVTKGKRRLSI